MEDIHDVGYTNCLIVENNINCLIRDRIIKNGDNIPSWLLVEVLIRLPQKSIFRCKLVSKQWLSIILEPYFVRLYCSRAQQHRNWAIFGSRIFLDYSERPHFLDYDDSSSKPAICFYPFPTRNFIKKANANLYKIYGVSNGLVLYKFINHHTPRNGYIKTTIFRICNPATGQWIALPPHDDYVNDNDRVGPGFVTNVEDGVLFSFTVVRMYSSTKCQVYFSEVGEWKMYNVHIDGTIPIETGENIFTVGHRSTALNGIIYWILRGNVLLAYDPRKIPDQARVIALPPETDYNSFWDEFDLCSEYQGQLRYFRASYVENNILSSFSIWVMNKAEDWCLQHRVNHVDNIFSRKHQLLFPVSFHSYDSDIVFLRCFDIFFDILLSYSFKTRKMQVEENFDLKNTIGHKGVYLLLIPPWPISVSCRHPRIEPERID